MNPIYEKLYALQTAYNAHTNITRIASKEDYYLKHIEDSLALLPFLDLSPVHVEGRATVSGERDVRLIDIGTGGGYPGIPLAIERPDLQITLNDATQKKVKYLQSVIDELPLPNARAVWERAEKLNRQKEHQGQYALATARAVAELKELLPLAAPFLRVGGRALFMKAKNIEAEIKSAEPAARKNKMVLLQVRKYRLADMDRAIVVYEKTK